MCGRFCDVNKALFVSGEDEKSQKQLMCIVIIYATSRGETN